MSSFEDAVKECSNEELLLITSRLRKSYENLEVLEKHLLDENTQLKESNQALLKVLDDLIPSASRIGDRPSHPQLQGTHSKKSPFSLQSLLSFSSSVKNLLPQSKVVQVNEHIQEIAYPFPKTAVHESILPKQAVLLPKTSSPSPPILSSTPSLAVEEEKKNIEKKEEISQEKDEENKDDAILIHAAVQLDSQTQKDLILRITDTPEDVSIEFGKALKLSEEARKAVESYLIRTEESATKFPVYILTSLETIIDSYRTYLSLN